MRRSIVSNITLSRLKLAASILNVGIICDAQFIKNIEQFANMHVMFYHAIGIFVINNLSVR